MRNVPQLEIIFCFIHKFKRHKIHYFPNSFKMAIGSERVYWELYMTCWEKTQLVSTILILRNGHWNTMGKKCALQIFLQIFNSSVNNETKL